MVKKAFFKTPFGQMIAIADDTQLHLLQFTDSVLLDKQIDQIQALSGIPIVHGSNSVLDKLARELEAYFDGMLKKFTIRIRARGTQFQKQVWENCYLIEYGSTIHYQGLAQSIDRPGASRAVGTALGSNYYALLIPCHRVVKADGLIGNYAAGAQRKKLLLDHERFFKNRQ